MDTRFRINPNYPDAELRDVIRRVAPTTQFLSDPYVKRVGLGMAECSLCKRTFEANGVGFRNHIRGKVHQGKLKEKETRDS